MPPKKGAKTKAAKQPSSDDLQFEEQLAKIDLWIDTIRNDLESTFASELESISMEVQSMLNRLPTSVKNMKMADFLRECGGDVQVLMEKAVQQEKLARTAARIATSKSRIVSTVARPTSRSVRIPSEGVVDFRVAPGTALPTQTPAPLSSRSRLDDFNTKTPSMSLMRSAVPSVSVGDVKTPVVSKKRSADNKSDDNAASQPTVSAALHTLPEDNVSGSTFAGAIQVSVGQDTMLLAADEEVDAIADDPEKARAMLEALEALQAKTAALQSRLAERMVSKGDVVPATVKKLRAK